MCKNITVWVALTLMLGFVTAFIPTTPASAAEANARLASSATICKGQPIPSGYVITSETRTSRCPSISVEDNAWIIETPGSREVVCKGSPIPSGYVITEERRQYRCPSISIEDNAWLIEIPGSAEIVCKGSPIPSGYVITEERRQYRCPSISIEDNAWVIKRL